MRSATTGVEAWKARYRDQHRTLLAEHPEFAAWLEDEYVPLAGGWQY
jgi:hypothetical protein